MTRIFGDFERTDAAPAYDTESSYHFLNRAARPQWELVRDLVEDWFSEYPEDAQADVRNRFQDDDYGQHMGAWWELYTYRLFRRLGNDVSIHPVLANTSRQPDFMVARDGMRFYVECVVYLSNTGPISGQGDGERSWIFEATNKASDPNFMLDIEIHQAGTQRPKSTEITRPLESWLSSLDPDEVSRQIEAGAGAPERVLKVRGWVIEYSAWPVKPERRGEQGRLIGVYPMTGGDLNNEMVRFRDIVRRKGGRYGLPDKPLIVAVLNTSGFLDEDEVTEALFGSEVIQYYEGIPGSLERVRRRDGYWRQGPPKRGSRVSGVLLGANIYPWRVSAELPELWVNPWADTPTDAYLPFTTRTANDNGQAFCAREKATTADKLFGLTPGWPGFN
jgi:hypothetical protein